MDIILACLFIVASFLLVLFSCIAEQKSVRIALSILWIALLVFGQISVSDQITWFFFASVILARVVTHFVSKRKVKLPRIRASDPDRWDLLPVYLLLIICLSTLCLFRPSDNCPKTLIVAAVGVLLIDLLSQRCEICGNGIWRWGELHPWEQYESFSWTAEDKGAVVQLKLRKEFPERFGSHFLMLTVPPENTDAAKQLLEANLVNVAWNWAIK